MRIRQRLEEHGIDNAEYGRIRADAQHQRQQSDGSKSRSATETPQRVAKISPQRLNEVDAPSIAALLLRSLHSTKLQSSLALRCVRLCGAVGYGEDELLEKWARDAKILDIFEGTQQIQLLIIARQLLKKTSAELK